MADPSICVHHDCAMLPSIENLSRHAVFLDFDGTLVGIADRPNEVHAEASMLQLLERISYQVDRALAVVTGREIATIDRFLHPLKLPVGGVHGLERRDSLGRLHRTQTDDTTINATARAIAEAIGFERGVAIEIKSGAVALHFRLRPDLERRCCEIAEGLTCNRPDLVLLRGKKVFEIKFNGENKGTAIEAFLDEPPFTGRIPIFAGDDVTDEPGFIVVNALGGISIKIGPEESAASYRAENIDEFRNWLDKLALESPTGLD